MRLDSRHAAAIVDLSRQLAGPRAQVSVFGSRLDDGKRGGDLDLLLEVPEPVDNPALLAARLSARASRLMGGRRVDVLLAAPNLKRLPIHDIAFAEAQRL